jgi:hypothetical protein
MASVLALYYNKCEDRIPNVLEKVRSVNPFPTQVFSDRCELPRELRVGLPQSLFCRQFVVTYFFQSMSGCSGFFE